MYASNLEHLADAALLQRLGTLVARDRRTTARLLAHLAEVEARKLYAPAGFPSMHAYCVRKLHFSEDAAFKRIHVARVAREFPMMFAALADGRLHMGAVRLLASHLTTSNVSELVCDASHRTCAQVQEMLAARYPRSEALPLGEIVPPVRELPNETLRSSDLRLPDVGSTQSAGGSPQPADRVPDRPQQATWPVRQSVKPLSPKRFELRVTIDEATRNHLDRARELSGHDVEGVLAQALAQYVTALEKRKFAKTDKPRRSPRPAKRSRTIPAHVKRAVAERDGERCPYVGDGGQVCGERADLEFDHVKPVAFGGESTVDNVRLLCRTHNRLEAERLLGAGFMATKQATAQRDRAPARTQPSRNPPNSVQVPVPVSRAFS